MNTGTGYSERYEDALRLAASAHRDQPRKGTGIPYITHPVHVSLILMRHGFSTDVAIAGLLHDIVEDQGYDLARIEEQFGPHVAEIVGALSERKTDAQGNKRPWETRKQEGLKHLRRASLEAVAVKAADTLHNARCIALDVRREGPQVWQRFSRDPATSLGYFRQVVQVAWERMGCHPLVDELADAVDDVAQAVGESEIESPVG